MEVEKKDDGMIAIAILIVALVVGVVVWVNFMRKGGNSPLSQKHSTFSPPAEREAFIQAKDQLDANKSSQADELKKLLMRRAIKTIPILLQLQNEGSSIDRLYKKGMLTDDMHFKMKEIKAFVDQEFQDVKFEADELLQGWGEQIWQQAMQFHQMLQKKTEAPKEEQQAEVDSPPETEESVVAEKNDKTELKLTSEGAKKQEAEKLAKQVLEEEERGKKKTKGKK